MFLRAATALALVTYASAAWASDTPVYAPAPKWVKPAPTIDVAAITDKTPTTLISDQQQRIENGKVWNYYDGATHVTSAQMLNQVGTITLNWQPDHGDLIIHRAEIIRGDQHIDLLKQGAKFEVLHREQQLEKLQINGELTATMAVEGLRVGDILRLTFSITSKDDALKGYSQTVAKLLAAPTQAQFARLRISWPTGEPVHWRSYADGVTLKPVAQDGYDTLDVSMPIEKQPDLPANIPGRFARPLIVEAATFPDWQSVSKVMAPLYATDGAIAPDSALAAEVAKIKAASSDPRERAAAALQLVQDKVRYLFKGMDGGNYVPQSPAKTWQLRYGDCKAKTLLLLSILRAMDIQAEPILASSSLGDLVPKRLPSAGAFDHVLVHAVIGGKDYWLDGTASGTRLADLGDTPPFRYVLPVRATGSDLLPIPMHPNARPNMDVTLSYDQTAGLTLPATYKVTMLMRGQMAALIQSATAQANDAAKKQMVQRAIQNYIGDNLLTDYSFAFDPAAGSATVTAQGLVDSPWSKSDDRYQLDLDHTVSKVSFDPDRARPAWQQIPYASADPFTLKLTTRVHLPDGGKGFTFDGDQTLPAHLAGANFSRTTELKDGWITVSDTGATDGAEIGASEIPDAKAKFALAQTRLLRGQAPVDFPAHWQEVDTGRKQHLFGPLLAQFQKAIANADSDDTSPYSSLAAFHMRIYDWQAAAGDLTKAIAINPSADLYASRASMYTQLGEDDKALADLLSAQRLDPGNAGIAAQLANQYLDTNQFDKAQAIVDEKIAAGGKDVGGFQTLRGEILARTGKKDEAVKVLDGVIATRPGNPTLLNNRCWLKGTQNLDLPSALKDCTKSIELAESPASALDSRAMVYFRMGRMDDAMADLNAALNIAPGQAASLFMRGVILKSQGKTKEAGTDLTAARMMSPQIDKTYARYGIKP